MAHIQSDAVQLALDLLVREPDITGFFRSFIKTLVEESESHACGVWLLDADGVAVRSLDGLHRRPLLCEREPRLGRADAAARQHGARTCWRTRRAGPTTIEYTGNDARLPEPVREFNRVSRRRVAGHRATGAADAQPRMGGAVRADRRSECETIWRAALVEAMARQATLALHQSRLAEQSRARGAAAGGARRAQPHGARHPRHAGAGIRRHPDAASGGTALDGARCPPPSPRASRPPSIWRAPI